MEKLIKNYDELAISPNRITALQILEAGMSAIDTKKAVNDSITIKEEILSIQGKKFDLSRFKNIKVVGFGKSAFDGACALEDILGEKITNGVVLDIKAGDLKYLKSFQGTHPKPSLLNVDAGREIYDLLKDSTKDDLIIAIISGGGSSLLCYDEKEYEQGSQLYDSFLKSGKTITEINVVRKHLSPFKGGGLAKIAYPATMIGLIFSDIPGDNFKNVASGPTYKDATSKSDAEKIIKENNLGQFDLIETPKEDKYFENVHNFVLVSNKNAISAMEQKGRDLGYYVSIAGAELYDEMNIALEKIFNIKKENEVVLAAGEPSLIVKNNSGKGGRNLHMGLLAISKNLIGENDVFISFASDGIDNTDAAGAIADKHTIERIEKLGIDIDKCLENFESYGVFKNTHDLIFTGPTGANISDLMILLNRK